VLTSCGAVPIEDIKAGDSVWATEPESGQSDYRQVVRTYVHDTYKLVRVTVGGEEIVATPEHPFWVKGKGWVCAGDLRTGDEVRLADGSTGVVESVFDETLDAPVKVYNFEVEGLHTYYVGGTVQVLVHNTCGGQPPAPSHVARDSYGNQLALPPAPKPAVGAGSRSIDINNLPNGWTKTGYSGYTHIRDANDVIRVRVDPPDNKTPYAHMHRYDEAGNSLDVNGNVVSSKNPDAHIPLV
jgi:hypothetical protein